jgi:F-type H+-transporting ATPase subunit epsilon
VGNTFRCTVVTPAEATFEGDVVYASFPGWDGQQGVMPRRSPMLTRLGIGSLRLDFPDGSKQHYFVDGGFAQMQDDVLTILTERAAPADALSLSEAEAALNDANARAVAGGEDRVKVEADQQRARAQIALASAGH